MAAGEVLSNRLRADLGLRHGPSSSRALFPRASAPVFRRCWRLWRADQSFPFPGCAADRGAQKTATPVFWSGAGHGFTPDQWTQIEPRIFRVSERQAVHPVGLKEQP